MAISNRALDAALALAANPLLAPNMRRQDLPPGIEVLLRALSGNPEALAALVGMARISERKVLDALENYVQQVMLFNGAPPHRILGVATSASREDMRTHMRLLMIWLHPDRSGVEWRAAFSARVLSAWREAQLSGGETRAGHIQPPLRQSASHRGRRTGARQTWRQIPVSRKRGVLRRWSPLVAVAVLSVVSVTMAWALGAWSNVGHALRLLP